MDLAYVAISLTMALIALSISAISLGLHWRHKDESPALAGMSTRIQELQLQILDLGDKVQHWRRRDSVRKMREKTEETVAAELGANAPADFKKELRRRARGIGSAAVAE